MNKTHSISLIAVMSVLTLIHSADVSALPVLNLNTPGAENVTVFPDHVDHNLYYLSPTVMRVADKDGVPLFNYSEYGRRRYREALIQTTLSPQFDPEQMDLVKKRVLAINPKAQFTGIPFLSSKVIFGEILAPFMEATECTHLGGVIGNEENCSFHLNPLGVTVFKRQFSQNVAITLQLEYTVEGVAQNADATFSNRTGTYGVAGRIGGQELMNHPELFHDEWGNIIVMKLDL